MATDSKNASSDFKLRADAKPWQPPPPQSSKPAGKSGNRGPRRGKGAGGVGNANAQNAASIPPSTTTAPAMGALGGLQGQQLNQLLQQSMLQQPGLAGGLAGGIGQLGVNPMMNPMMLTMLQQQLLQQSMLQQQQQNQQQGQASMQDFIQRCATLKQQIMSENQNALSGKPLTNLAKLQKEYTALQTEFPTGTLSPEAAQHLQQNHFLLQQLLLFNNLKQNQLRQQAAGVGGAPSPLGAGMPAALGGMAGLAAAGLPPGLQAPQVPSPQASLPQPQRSAQQQPSVITPVAVKAPPAKLPEPERAPDLKPAAVSQTAEDVLAQLVSAKTKAEPAPQLGLGLGAAAGLGGGGLGAAAGLGGAAGLDLSSAGQGFSAVTEGPKSARFTASQSSLLQKVRARSGLALDFLDFKQRPPPPLDKAGRQKPAVAQFIVSPAIDPSDGLQHFHELPADVLAKYHTDLKGLIANLATAATLHIPFGSWKLGRGPYGYLSCTDYSGEVASLDPSEMPNPRAPRTYDDDLMKDVSDVILLQCPGLAQKSIAVLSGEELEHMYKVFMELFGQIGDYEIQICKVKELRQSFILKTQSNKVTSTELHSRFGTLDWDSLPSAAEDL